MEIVKIHLNLWIIWTGVIIFLVILYLVIKKIKIK